LLLAFAEPASAATRTDNKMSPGDSASDRGSLMVEFDDLVGLDDDALARVLRAADPQVALLALSGASQELVDRILRRLPLREARMLRRQIEQLGPTRLRDIETAQRQLADLTSQLAEEGLIQVRNPRRFTMAA
jgi:flagellar motor switch protein FliG